jgi:hypothetical protein
LVTGLSLVATSIALATGPVGTGAKFEDDDGNLIDQAPLFDAGPPATGDIDWNNFSRISWQDSPATTPTREADKVFNGWTFKGLEDWQASTSDSAFAGGTKQSKDCAVIITQKADNKADLKRVYVTSKTGSNGHVYLMLAWVRITQNTTSPSAHVAFEFNQSDDACPADGKDHDGLHPRTEGDMLVLYDFEGGSELPVISISRWTAASDWSAPDALTGGEAEAKVNSDSTALDALASPALSSTTGTSVDETLGIKEFGEAGIDLTEAGVFPETPTSCLSFGSVFGVTRTSGNSDTAQMKDIVGPGDINITNCGKVIIRKVTSPTGDTTTSFGYTTNVETLPATTTSPFDPELKDGDSNTIDNVKAASGRTVTEDDPSDPIPLYLLTNINCAVAAHPSTVPAANISTNTGTRTVTFAIAAGETLDCTFTNTKQKQQSSMDTAPWIYPNDKATVTPTDATGSVTFKLYGATNGGTPKTAEENCDANGATGLLYSETVNLPASAPLTVNTSNPGTTGSPNSVKVESTATVFWRVAYSGDSNYFGRLSDCEENINATLTGHTGGTNVPDAP